MKEEFSFLAIFQDPLLTIIALILMSTVWMIIPMESKPIDPKSYTTKEEVDSIKKDIQLIEQRINEQQLIIQRLIRELGWLESQLKEAKAKPKAKKEDIEQIEQMINELRLEIQRKREELSWLESKLKEMKEKIAKAEGKEDIEQIKQKIRELEIKIQSKKQELSWLEKQIKKAKEERAKAKEKEHTLQGLIARLQNELKSILEENKRLEQEIDNMEEATAKSGGGFNPIIKSDKKPFFVELVDNHLFPVDQEHYDEVFGYLEVQGGKIVSAVKKTRKPLISGEDIKRIENPRSDFHKVLGSLNKKEERIVFLVHEDSFEIFRKAREIALERGFEIGWWPHEKDSITFVSAGGKAIGSTGRPRRP